MEIPLSSYCLNQIYCMERPFFWMDSFEDIAGHPSVLHDGGYDSSREKV